jgi:ATP-dependent Clp protease ATP-binding subunit ClpA
MTSMFARFTDDARRVVVDAQAEARRLSHCWIGCEHLLLALTRRPNPVAAVFAARGVTSTAVEQTLCEFIRPAVNDADALASIGIDLDEVRARVEASFGPGALDRATLRKPRWRHRLGRRRGSCAQLSTRQFLSTGGLMPFTPRAKRGLEIAAKTAEPGHVRPSHLGVALVSRSDTVAGEVLQRLGVDLDALRAELSALSSDS